MKGCPKNATDLTQFLDSYLSEKFSFRGCATARVYIIILSKFFHRPFVQIDVLSNKHSSHMHYMKRNHRWSGSRFGILTPRRQIRNTLKTRNDDDDGGGGDDRDLTMPYCILVNQLSRKTIINNLSNLFRIRWSRRSEKAFKVYDLPVALVRKNEFLLHTEYMYAKGHYQFFIHNY